MTTKGAKNLFLAIYPNAYAWDQWVSGTSGYVWVVRAAEDRRTVHAASGVNERSAWLNAMKAHKAGENLLRLMSDREIESALIRRHQVL